MEVIKLEQVRFSFIISHGQELTLVTECQREWVLENSRSDTGEILEDSVRWYVR